MTQSRKLVWPVIIDFEASSLGVGSYPIEVAWTSDDGVGVEEHLINPDSAPDLEDWKSWSWASQAVHGISREELIERGEDVRAVAKRMNEVLRGRKVYSDAVKRDRHWCERLFCAANLEMEFSIDNYWDLLRSLGNLGTETIVEFKEEANARIPGAAHRAGIDALRLLEVLKLAGWKDAQDRHSGGLH